MTACVLDACVAAKWFLIGPEEANTEEALRILRGFDRNEIQLLVPSLFWAELGNILWKAVRRQRISLTAAERAIRDIDTGQIVTTPTQTLWKTAFSIAAAYDRSVYDCVYVALAAHLNTPLVTADERLANALGGYFPVRFLGSW